MPPAIASTCCLWSAVITPDEAASRISTNANSPTCASPSDGAKDFFQETPVALSATIAANDFTAIKIEIPLTATIGSRMMSTRLTNSPKLTKNTAENASRNGNISESICSDQRFPPNANPAAKAPMAGGNPIRCAARVTAPRMVKVSKTTKSGLRCRVMRGITVRVNRIRSPNVAAKNSTDDKPRRSHWPTPAASPVPAKSGTHNNSGTRAAS